MADQLDFGRPGKFIDNGINSFDGTFRAQSVKADWFLSLNVARARDSWRSDWNASAHKPSSGANTGYRC